MVLFSKLFNWICSRMKIGIIFLFCSKNNELQVPKWIVARHQCSGMVIFDGSKLMNDS